MLAGFAAKHRITYPLLADVGSVVIRRLGLLNERVFEQHAAFGIPRRDHFDGVPYPGAFLLDAGGVITEKRFQQSYRERETGAAILEQGFGIEEVSGGAEAGVPGPTVALRAHLDAPAYRLYQRRWLTVDLAIAPGWHVYGNPIPDGYIPLALTVAPVEGVLVGEPSGPAPRPFRLEGLDEQFTVFEGNVRFQLPLTFNAKLGDVTLAVEARYQACDAASCLSPVTTTLDLRIRAENLVDLDR